MTNLIYASVRKRGTALRLTWTNLCCLASAVFLFPAIIWFSFYSLPEHQSLMSLTTREVLIYVFFFGWVVPIGLLLSFLLFAGSRVSPRVTRRLSTPIADPSANPPRYRPGVTPPYVFGEGVPWGWLEYMGGSFHGQRLALARSIIRIGRDEQCDIWLDDEVASRFHAELAWDQGIVYLTDCNSLNGLMLDTMIVHNSVRINTGSIIEIGTHKFLFVLAERASQGDEYEDDDPLSRHTWRSSDDLQTNSMHLSGIIPPVSLPMRSIPPSFQSGSTESGEAQRSGFPIETEGSRPSVPFSPAPKSGPAPLRLPGKARLE